MDRASTEITLREGADVFGADGDKVGKIIGVSSSYIVVEKGFFFPTDYYIPISAIAGQDPDGGKVYLSVGKEEALDLGWDIEPELSDRASDRPYDASGGAVYAAERAAQDFNPGSPALGTTGYMGESPTSPGVAADLTELERTAGSREL